MLLIRYFKNIVTDLLYFELKYQIGLKFQDKQN